MAEGYWKDEQFQNTVLTWLCKDRNFLKDYGPLLRADDFKPSKGQTPERYLLADTALNFWKEYSEPIGGLLRTEVLDLIREERIQGDVKDKLLHLQDKIDNANGLIAPEALGRKIVQYKQRRARRQIVQDMIIAEEAGLLTNAKLLAIANRINDRFGQGYRSTEYGNNLKQRIQRREMEKKTKWPYLLIDSIDAKLRILSRGTLGMFLSPWKTGKSVALIWVAWAMAVQGYNVLFFTLEDPQEQVEDRFDAMLTRIPMKSLRRNVEELKRLYKDARTKLRGRIRIIDGTDGGMTVQMMEAIWDQERNKGFSAECVIIDYDDEIEPPEKYGKDGRRFEFADIYRELRRFAARRQLFVWTAAQATRKAEDQKVITGREVAEDISKIRKCAICIGIGRHTALDAHNGRHLYIAAHKFDQSKIGFDIVGSFKEAVFYDQLATQKKVKELIRKSRQLRLERGG